MTAQERKTYLTDFTKWHPQMPYSTLFTNLTPELLATARPFGSDDIGWDISVYRNPEAVTAMGQIGNRETSFRSQSDAQEVINELREAIAPTTEDFKAIAARKYTYSDIMLNTFCEALGVPNGTTYGEYVSPANPLTDADYDFAPQ
jgi:hypothetical protein